MLEPACFIVRIDLAKHVFYAIACSSLLFTFCGQKVTSGSRLANQHYLSACFLGRCCIGHVSHSPAVLGHDRRHRKDFLFIIVSLSLSSYFLRSKSNKNPRATISVLRVCILTLRFASGRVSIAKILRHDRAPKLASRCSLRQLAQCTALRFGTYLAQDCENARTH